MPVICGRDLLPLLTLAPPPAVAGPWGLTMLPSPVQHVEVPDSSAPCCSAHSFVAPILDRDILK